MLGQTQPLDLSNVVAWVAGAVLLLGPGAVGVTKLVDAVRSLDKNDTWPAWVWIATAFVIGVGSCLVFEMNLVASLVVELPRFTDSTVLNGTVGQVVTGVAIAGMASYQHERMDRTASEAGAARRVGG